MKLPESASHWIARVGLTIGLALLAGILLTVSIAVSAETAHPSIVSAPPAAKPGIPAPATQAAQPAPETQPQTDQRAPAYASEAASAASSRPSTDPAEAVQRAWERARDVGVYRFATDLGQSNYPARTLSNAGRGPQRVDLHMEGDVDLPAHTMEFRLWQPGLSGSGSGGSVITPGSGAEARVEGDRAYVRPAGGDWKEVEDFSTGFAPANDPLAFLAGIRDVREVPAEEQRSGGAEEQRSNSSRSTFHLSRFTFDLDGPALATYLRDQLERQLSERGGLPLNVTLDAPSGFREMTGQGELWVDGRNLPLRLQVHLVFPEQRDGSRLEADIQTDFSGFPEQLAASPSPTKDPLAWAGTLFSESAIRNPQSAIKDVAEASGTGGALACGLGVTALMLACRRSRRLYSAVVVAVILSMVVVPLMQSERAIAFFERQAVRAQDLMILGANGQLADAESAQASDSERQAVEEFLAPPWNPQQDPMAQPDRFGRGSMNDGPATRAAGVSLATASAAPEGLNCDQDDTADPDNDGMNNFEECVYGVEPGSVDTDNDGLTDGQELNKLGTDPTNPDTDGDMITDTLEVRGFELGGRQWYLDPNNVDTNNDALIDSVECPPLVSINPEPDVISAKCDSDQDGIPNPFEFDNDDDGVPDRVDLAPDGSVDQNGKRYGQATSATAFNGGSPFKLSVSKLQPNWPVFVDLQLRPVITKHLAYSLNVLDWPAGDVDGQIQHGKNTTFANSDNPDIRNPQDAAGANGDMRLVPLLEIEMTGQHIPLRMTDPAATAAVRGEISATVKVEQGASHADTSLAFAFDKPDLYDVKIYDGSCPVSGSPVKAFSGVGSGAVATYTGKKVVELADGSHAMVVSSGTRQQCAIIPNVVNGPYTDRMVDVSVLSPYGISVQERNKERALAVVAYVPLNVAPDDTGGGRSAFQARMLYWPGANTTWDEPQKMRVVWLVQMLSDSCAEGAKTWEDYHQNDLQKSQEDYAKYIDSWCRSNRSMDQIELAQVYDESWYLTGLTVREDHGLDVAVAYANPQPQTYDDDALWTLSWGLGQQFISGRDCETDATIYGDPNPDSCHQDKVRDLTIFANDAADRRIGNSTIRERFDITSSVASTYRWGTAPNALRVENFRYDHRDYLAYLAMTETPRILALYPTEVTPTLLFAREERYRSAGLEAAALANGVLAMDLDPTAHRETTLTGLQWAPFHYNRNPGSDGKVIGWEGYPTSDYWDTRTEDLKARFYKLFPEDDAETNMGRVATARAYDFALINGVANIVQCTSEDSLCPVEEKSASDEMSIKATEAMLGGLNHVAVEVVFETMAPWEHFRTHNTFTDLERNGDVAELDELLTNMSWTSGEVAHHLALRLYLSLGRELLGAGLKNLKALFAHGPSAVRFHSLVLGAAAIFVVATIVIFATMGLKGAQIATIVMRVGMSLVTALSLVYALRAWTKPAADAAKVVAKAAQAGKGILNSLWFAAILLVVNLALVWGAFLVEFFLGHMVPGSLAFYRALSGSISATILTIALFLFFAALGPVGAVIAAVVALLDLFVSLICTAVPEKARQNAAAAWLCGGLTGLIVNYWSWLLHSGAVMVDLNPAESKGPPWYPRLAVHDFSVDLVEPEKGVVTGSKMRYSISLTNTLDLARRPFSPFEMIYWFQFNDKNLKKANFDYRLQQEQEAFHKDLRLGGLSGKWQPQEGRPVYYTETVATEGGIQLTEAGINRPAGSLYLSEAYAVPEQECWWWVLPVCFIKAEKATNHSDLGSELTFDVLPATLDGFYQLARKEGGWALAWDQQGDLTFPTLRDADGDGLSWSEDPDDSKWDADGDGLSDYYEHATGSDPTLADSDRDGLSDPQEARFGTDPSSADSDGDGLYDCQEVFHEVVTEDLLTNAPGAVCGSEGLWSGGWSIVYGMVNANPLTTLVASDPVVLDTDADGLTDFQERTYGYNPRLYSELNVLSLTSELSEVSGGEIAPSDGFVAPGQMLAYSATVKNELDNRQAQGLFSTATSPVLNSAGLLPRSFVLRPQAQASVSGTLDVLPTAASGAYSLTQVAGALITDLSVESNDASLWLRFDDPAGSTVFADSSGRLPANDGRCSTTGACPLDPAGGRYGGALQLNGAGFAHSNARASKTGYGMSLWFKTTGSGQLFSVETADASRLLLQVDVQPNGTGYYAMEGIAGREGNAFGAPGSLNNGQWHHLVHTFGSSIGGQKVYVDGALLNSLGATALSTSQADGVNIGGHTPSIQGTGNFSGWIDDVRLFDRALTAADVAGLINEPVFRMDFDADAWRDVSRFRTAIADCGSHCPGPTAIAVAGRAAAFNGTQYLHVPTAAQLDLSGGQFTIAAWIRPESRGGAPITEGILGLNSGRADAYPSLQRVGRKINFSFGTGSQWLAPYVSGDVLTEGQWTHVAVVYDRSDAGTLKLYINGVLAETKAFAAGALAATRSIDIGRSSSAGNLYIQNFHQTHSYDRISTCGDWATAEMCMAIDKQEVLNRGFDCGDDYAMGRNWAVTGLTTLQVWEDDTDPKCGSAPNGDDDICALNGSSTQLSFTPNDPGNGVLTQQTFGNCGDGYFKLSYTNTTPFYGKIDEVVIYNQALRDDAVKMLFIDSVTALHLPLDEAPGASAFSDTSFGRTQAVCGAAGCPTSGVDGRLNRAVWFGAAKSQSLSLAHGPAYELVNSFTVAAWIKPSALSASQRIASAARTKSNNGWGFGLAGSELRFTSYGVSDRTTSGLGLQKGGWYHVAAVVDASNNVSMYVDGVLKASLPAAGAVQVDTDDLLMIGATTEPGSAAPRELFDGRIDDLWVFKVALPADKIVELYDSAPILHLRFDEARGATRFADDAAYDRFGVCSGTSCPVTGEAVRGQVGLAAEFDGVKDMVVVPDSPALRPASFTVGAWVMPITASQNLLPNPRHELVGKWDNSYKYPTNFDLWMYDNLKPGLTWGCAGTREEVYSKLPLILNHWNHLMGTFDGKALRIYLNGAEQGVRTVPAGSTCTSAAAIEIGGDTNLTAVEHFNGRLDEVVLYKRALGAGEVRDLHRYQSGWFEDRQSRDITVDSNLPTAEILLSGGAYLANQTIWVGVTADDPTSAVANVELGVQKDGGSFTWTDTSRCAEGAGQGEGAWCPEFAPSGQAVYTLKARATDGVGNTGSSAPVSVYVDDTPPMLTIDQGANQRVDAAASQTEPNMWTIHLSGTVNDPVIATGVAGSGVPSDAMHVTLRDASGNALGVPGQTATLAGSAWSVEYAVGEAKPTGCSEVQVTAEDNIARAPNLDLDQVARHSTTVSRWISLDADAPGVQLDWGNVADGQIGPATQTLSGAASARPVPVEVNWTTSGVGSAASLAISCQHSGSGSWYTAYAAPAGTFEPNREYSWSEEGQIHQGSACRVTLAAIGDTGVAGGQVKVCGVQVVSWTTERTVSFTATSSGCAPAGCGSGLNVAGVQAVDIAYTSVLPGSAFINEAPADGEVLHLAFEDTPDRNGVLSFRDASGGGHTGSCAGTACPSPGQAGPSGSAVGFDGVNDVVNAGNEISLANASFSAAFWAKRDVAGQNHVVIGQGAAIDSKGLYIGFRAGNQFTCGFWGNDLDTPAYTDSDWHHWACTYDAATRLRTIYRDGVQVAQAPASANYQGSGSLTIGAFPGSSSTFNGLVDDVRIVKRSLSAAEVQALYTGSGPLLVLPFEQSWASDGAYLPDASGWVNDGALHTGSGDLHNKAVVGEVGDYALAFDGVDDYASVESFGVFTNTTVSAWVYRTGTTAARETVVSYKEAGDCGFALALEGQVPVFNVRVGSARLVAVDGTNQVPLKRWVHLAGTYDGRTLRLYRDGQQVTTASGVGGMAQCSGATAIGSRSSGDMHWFAGAIDDVRVYGRALLAAEIADITRGGWQAATLAQSGDAVESTGWTATVPSGLEGAYRINMRGADVAGHSAAVRERTPLWSGEADTLAPRVTLVRAAVDSRTYRYTAVAEDYHLAETGFNSPCGTGVITTREYLRSPWYAAVAVEQKLYRLTVDCEESAGKVTEQATACDSFGNCTTVGPSTAETGRGGDVETRRHEDAETPEEGDAFRVTASPSPPVDLKQGKPKFDIALNSRVLTTTHYYEPRTVDLSGTVTAQNSPDAGPHALAGLQVSVGGVSGSAFLSEPASTAPYTVTWRFPWRLAAGDLPDGVGYTATLTATDRAGRTTTTSLGLAADVVPPAPVTVTLSTDGGPLAPGDVVRSASPELTLSWTPASDGSNPVAYTVSWTARSLETTTVTSHAHEPSGPLVDRITAGEAQQITAELTSRDRYGNQRWQFFGPVVADSPFTPDHIVPLLSPMIGGEAGGDGWLDSGCTLLGADRRIADSEGSRWTPQQLYATWDHTGLRLTWTGANWSDDGDLFVYLDTGEGGTASTFTPYPLPVTATVGLLPSDLDADTLIWVHSSDAATLLRWDGSAWVVQDDEGSPLLSAGHFRFRGEPHGGRTDLYLPFELLGIGAGVSVSLLAFATEEAETDAGLRVWATMPLANPVNSERVNVRTAFAPEGSRLNFGHAYRWAAVADGVCPNGSQGGRLVKQHNDATLELSFESDPPGASASGLEDGLFWVNYPGAGREGPPTGQRFGVLLAAQPPIPDGQEIAYRVAYRNAGSHTLKDAWLSLTALGSLQVHPDRVDLGDIRPGGDGTAEFWGTVDQGSSGSSAVAAVVKLYSATHGSDGEPLEWLAVLHRVDRGAPTEMGLEAPETPVGPETGWLTGYAYDESGVNRVEVRVQGPTGARSTLTCDLRDPASGQWSCPWNGAAANGGVRPVHGDVFDVWLRATDVLGHTNENWSAAYAVRVDAQPPTVTLSLLSPGASSARLVRGSTLRLTGEANDEAGVRSVNVCLDDDACRQATLGVPDSGVVWWSQWLNAAAAGVDAAVLDYVTKTISIGATDRLGNSTTEPLRVPVVFDNVAPVLEVEQSLAQAPLRGAGPASVSEAEAVLRGQVRDGGPEVRVSLRVEAPGGEIRRDSTARDGSAWWYDLPADTPGRYTLWVDAEDLAGNVSTAGPFTVDVVCTDAAPVVTGVSVEPMARKAPDEAPRGSAVSMTLTAVISNTGRDPLPAGIPVAFYEGDQPIGVTSTSSPLDPGETQPLSVVWAPDGGRDYDIGVVVGQVGRIGNSPYTPLCGTPPAAHFTVPVQDLPLYMSWNLISPPVDPDNKDVQVVQRPIEGAYSFILGYDGDLLAYYPDRPQESTLKMVDALHGYWIKTIAPPNVPPEELLGEEQVAAWRLVGRLLPEDRPLSLAAGWNLVGYLPRQPLTVTAALQGIEGRYGAVLGFERTALSHYPDLDASYNTLYRMAPGYGYWINAGETLTLSYPVSAVTQTLPFTASLAMQDRMAQVRVAEWEAGVRPTYEWMNFYGKLALPDGTGVPTGTIVLAVDPRGVICGATTVWKPGQYGLLACYADDPDTDVDEGASPGDTIRLAVAEGTPPRPGSWVIGAGTWTAHGARQQVPGGPPLELPYRSYLPLLLREALVPVEGPEPVPEPAAGS